MVSSPHGVLDTMWAAPLGPFSTQARPAAEASVKIQNWPIMPAKRHRPGATASRNEPSTR
jgi:hypothetical protein